ncbi:DNA-binding beta-propeller fold protein YncE [Paenibacillus amylolyticus]|uniref:DNA-binding beta-propeller fold protein YncE n=1 Tax=Paenibacillus amylolyticus TaxID=1451 RepID=A0AAP5LK36_PAEAM|nr:DNA-binding beta-propeller fold protein YncE [Paenibacillus amylolyticus]
MRASTRNKRKWIIIGMVCLLLFGHEAPLVNADGTSDAYHYSYWGEAVPAPAAYEATAIITGRKLNTDAFKEPSDLHVTADERVFLLDSGNGRIIEMDRNFKLVRVIDSFEREGQPDHFNNPRGLYVTDKGHLLVADSDNQRVVHLDELGQLVNIVAEPQSDLLRADFQFKPIRVVMDKGERIYVMAEGVFDGFMEFNADGTFSSFIGANRVQVDPVEYLWKRFATREQRSQMVMFTPTEFTNLDMDEEGFIYATSGDRGKDPIKKLNAQGTDILRREGYQPPQGDMMYTTETGPSRLIDVDVGDSDMYSVLDANTGRVFTYNGDGYLLHIFGGIGNRQGQFNTPVALERAGERILVLDKALGEITVFQTTEYGRTLHDAVRSYYNGDEDKSSLLFAKAAEMNANLEYAYAGIGKALLRQKEYADSAQYFKRSMERLGYSKAFLLFRKELMREHFSWMMSGLFLAVGSLVTVMIVRRQKRRTTNAGVK